MLEDRQIRGAVAVDVHDIVLDGEGVRNVRHVPQQHRRAAHHLDRNLVELADQ